MYKVDNHSSAGGSDRQLRGNLDRLAGDGRWFLQRWRMREELRDAAGIALLGLFVFPLLLLLVQLTQRLLGITPGAVSWWVVVLLALAGPVLYVLMRLGMTYYRYHPRRQNALKLYDEELKTHDRLVTADEFLDETVSPDDRSVGFRQAAVADADGYARSALNAALSPLSLRDWRIRPTSWLGIPAAALVALLMFLLGPGISVTPEKGGNAPLLAALDTGEDVAREQQSPLRKLFARRLQEQPKDQQQPSVEKQKIEPFQNRQSRNAKAAEGQSNTGNSAMAQSSSNSSTAAGEPSSQKNSSRPKKPEEEKQEEPNEDSKSKKPKKKPEEQKTTQMAMEATSGQGKTSMSKSSPSQFNLPEEEDKAGVGAKQEGKDTEAEDEDEEEKSNAANKPSLRDKKSPMDRNLSQAFVRKSEPRQTNGRSGPTGRKKTRGVPSMILGIPVQDRLQGMLNAGRSKVTQEEAKPKQESHASLDAQIRLARNEDVGYIEHPGMLPWMRVLVSDYFISLRQSLGLGSGAPTDADVSDTTDAAPAL